MDEQSLYDLEALERARQLSNSEALSKADKVRKSINGVMNGLAMLNITREMPHVTGADGAPLSSSLGIGRNGGVCNKTASPGHHSHSDMEMDADEMNMNANLSMRSSALDIEEMWKMFRSNTLRPQSQTHQATCDAVEDEPPLTPLALRGDWAGARQFTSMSNASTAASITGYNVMPNELVDQAGTSEGAVELHTDQPMSASLKPGDAGLQHLPSPGSKLHLQGNCHPCVFFWKHNCKSGAECLHCHFYHDKPIRPGKNIRNRMKTKKQREQETRQKTEAAEASKSSVEPACP